MVYLNTAFVMAGIFAPIQSGALWASCALTSCTAYLMGTVDQRWLHLDLMVGSFGTCCVPPMASSLHHLCALLTQRPLDRETFAPLLFTNALQMSLPTSVQYIYWVSPIISTKTKIRRRSESQAAKVVQQQNSLSSICTERGGCVHMHTHTPSMYVIGWDCNPKCSYRKKVPLKSLELTWGRGKSAYLSMSFYSQIL